MESITARDIVTESAKRRWLIRSDLLDGLAHGIHVFLQCGGPAGREPEADEATGAWDPRGREFVGDPPDRGGAHPHLRAVHQGELGELVAAGQLQNVVYGFLRR